MNKHDVNIKKGKLINFQIGIIAIISFCYIIHEVNHYTSPIKKNIAYLDKAEMETFDSMGPVEVYVEPKIIEPTVIKKPKITPIKLIVTPEVKPVVVKNTTEVKIVETKITSTEVKTKIKTTSNIESKKSKKPMVLHTSMSVDVLPVFPGCDKYSSNDERASCFQEKIQRMINRKFDRSIGNELGLSGLQRINLYFEIDKNGQVSNIKARSNYPEFITEAKRVANLLPKMEPARRKGDKVKMAYNVPIVFKSNK